MRGIGNCVEPDGQMHVSIRHDCDIDYKSIYGNMLLAGLAMANSSECLVNKKVKAVVQAYFSLPKLSQ